MSNKKQISGTGEHWSEKPGDVEDCLREFCENEFKTPKSFTNSQVLKRLQKHFSLGLSASPNDVLHRIWESQGADLSLNRLSPREIQYMRDWRVVGGQQSVKASSEDKNYGFNRPYVSDYEFLKDLRRGQGILDDEDWQEYLEIEMTGPKNGLERAIRKLNKMDPLTNRKH